LLPIFQPGVPTAGDEHARTLFSEALYNPKPMPAPPPVTTATVPFKFPL
jgi:hypothetical protein